MATPNWEDVNKLLEQNKQMRIWIEKQRTYIKALAGVIPSALMEDWSSTLPALPDIPESLEVWEPQRMLKNPIDDSKSFSLSFAEKPALPPRDSPTGIKARTSQKLKLAEEPVDADLYNQYFASVSTLPSQIANHDPKYGNAISKYFESDKNKYEQ